MLSRHQAIRVPLLQRIHAQHPTRMTLCLGPRWARRHRPLLSLHQCQRLYRFTPNESNPLPATLEGKPAAFSPPTDESPAPIPESEPNKVVPAEPASSTVTSEIPLAGHTALQAVGEVSRALPGSLQAAATNAAKALQNAAGNVANVVGGFLSGASDTSPPNGVESPSKGMLQPSSPIAPPIGGGSFFSLLGGGLGGITTSSSVTPLLLCILMLGLILLRPDGKLSRVFCELPKPSSALLLPLERPG